MVVLAVPVVFYTCKLCRQKCGPPEYREAFSFLGPLPSLNRALSDEDEVEDWLVRVSCIFLSEHLVFGR